MREGCFVNLFDVPEQELPDELCDVLLHTDGVRMERIVSTGQASPEGFWYDQEEAEWVVLLQGEAELGFEHGVKTLQAGEHILLPAHCRHRVNWTSREPACIWLCVFYQTGGIDKA